MEVLQLIKRRWRYFKDVDNYFQLALFSSTIIFICGFDKEYWCSTPGQWQIGAVAVFLSWLNFIFIFKYMPYGIAGPINMFLSISVTFLRLILLPILLLLAFGVPHYMVFVRTQVSCQCTATDYYNFRPFIYGACGMTFIPNSIIVCVFTSILATIFIVCSLFRQVYLILFVYRKKKAFLHFNLLIML